MTKTERKNLGTAFKRGQALLQSWVRGRRLTASARSRWGKAETFADLSELTAVWLEGDLGGHPSYWGEGPDDETAGLVQVLAGANRAGFITVVSQPGVIEVDDDGSWWQQRAAVAGYVDDDDLLQALTHAANVAGLWFVIHSPAGLPDENLMVVGDRTEPSRDGGATVVTTRDGVAVTGFGHRYSEATVRFDYDNWCTRPAVDELVDSWQLTIIDPEWGRDTLLWATLNEALELDADVEATYSRQGKQDRPSVCPSCSVDPGQAHGERCDQARCPECGNRRPMCDEHPDTDRPALWHGIDQSEEAAQTREWWTTIPEAHRLIEDHDRVQAAVARGELAWDPRTQRYIDPR